MRALSLLAAALVALAWQVACRQADSAAPPSGAGAHAPLQAPRGAGSEGGEARARSAPARPQRGLAHARPVGAEGELDVDPTRDLAPRFPVVPGRTWQEVSYLGAARDRIPALFRPARRPGRRPAVILGHGHGGDAVEMSLFFGDKLSREVHVLAVNHPFHGHGRKQRGEDICPKDAERLVERWIRAVRDLRHALGVLGARADVDPARIGYLGFSLGGCLGALFAAHEPRLRAAALVAPAADWKLLASTDSFWHLGFGGQPLGAWLGDPRLAGRLAVIDPARSIARFAPRPLLVVVGENDRVIRASSGQALFRAAGKGKELLLHPGGHGPGGALRLRIARWLERQLGMGVSPDAARRASP